VTISRFKDVRWKCSSVDRRH